MYIALLHTSGLSAKASSILSEERASEARASKKDVSGSGCCWANDGLARLPIVSYRHRQLYGKGIKDTVTPLMRWNEAL